MSEKKPWLAHYPEFVPDEIKVPEINVPEILCASARTYPDDIFLQVDGQRYTYAEVDGIVDHLARNLIWMGVEKGDRVGVILPNTPEFVYSFFAILKAGAIVVAINPAYKLREITRELQIARVRWVITNDHIYPDVKQIQSMTGVSKILVARTRREPDETGWDPQLDRIILRPDMDLRQFTQNVFNPEIQLPDVSPNDPAIFQFTGGITGAPKPAIGLHRNLIANVIQFRSWIPDLASRRPTFLAAPPLFHVYGMVLAMLLGASCGSRILIVEQPTHMDKLLEIIEKERPEFFPAVPALMAAISNHCRESSSPVDLTSLKVVISGASMLPVRVKEEFEGFTHGTVYEGYGLSEAPTATHCNPISGVNMAGSIGLPLPGVDCRILDLESGEDLMEEGKPGEFWVRGPQVMQGYYESPLETRETLVDGWLKTGDIARMDTNGYFYILGRKKELVKVGGMQVWPAELEEVLLQNPAVADCGAAGIPDPIRGEVMKAWVVKRTSCEIGTEELIEWCRSNLASYKVPISIVFVKTIPRTSVGKIKRQELVRLEE